MDITPEEIKKMLDVALLQPINTAAQIEELAQIVRDEGFGQICIKGLWVKRAAAILKGSLATIDACVGFPMGAMKTEVKVFETEQAIADGAEEIDMVLNLGAFLGGDWKYAESDVRAVVQAAAGYPVKVIIETPYLDDRQTVDACHLVQNAGAAFVKTCTGASPDPMALFEDVRLIRRMVGPDMGIKASGRVGSYFRFTAMLEAGATRVGLVLPQAREILRGWELARQAEGEK